MPASGDVTGRSVPSSVAWYGTYGAWLEPDSFTWSIRT